MNRGKHLLLATVVGAVLALLAAAGAFAKPQTVRVGNLILTGNGGISPTKLPKHGQAPVSARVIGQIGTVDGSTPPALTAVNANFDKNIQVNARGLPACPRGRLEATPTVAAKKACPDAIVGSGEGEVEVAFPEQAPFSAKGPIVLFNGGIQGGATVLFVHTYVAVPAPTAVVAVVKITHIRRGHYGLHAEAALPPIAGGAGSVTKFGLSIDRKFIFKGKKESYLTAGCPTGHYYSDAEVVFASAAKMTITHVFPCTPVG
jgi:hypothetical protein